MQCHCNPHIIIARNLNNIKDILKKFSNGFTWFHVKDNNITKSSGRMWYFCQLHSEIAVTFWIWMAVISTTFHNIIAFQTKKDHLQSSVTIFS